LAAASPETVLSLAFIVFVQTKHGYLVIDFSRTLPAVMQPAVLFE